MAAAMFTALSGMLASQTQLDVTANNLANSETNGFKTSQVAFNDHLYDLVSRGRGASGNLGGVDPYQIGNGVLPGAINVQFTQGPIDPTNRPLDMAISGNGFFRLADGNGGEVYTRVGNFAFDGGGTTGTQVLVDQASGKRVLNTQGQTIPLVTTLAATATTAVRWTGNLAPSDPAPLQGTTLHALFPLAKSDGTTVSAQTPLADLTVRTGAAAATTLNLFGTEADGTAWSRSLPLTATATVQDLVDGLNNQLLKTVPTLDVNGNPVLDGSGNPVTHQERIATVTRDGSSLIATAEGTGGKFSLFLGETAPPAQPTTLAAANTWQHTAAGVYEWDRLRFTPSSVSQTVSFYSADGTSHELSGRWFASGIDGSLNRSWDLVLDQPTGGTLAAGSQVVQGLVFRSDGSQLSAPAPTITATWTTGGATSFTVDASAITGQQLASAVDSEDLTGAPAGTLTSVSVSQDGVIQGSYSNDKTVAMSATGHQVGLAMFANPAGLMALGGNYWDVGLDSGGPVDALPGAQGTNLITGGALEGSNVDVAQEFTRLIVTQRAFQSNSKAFQIADSLIETANNLIR